MHLSRVCFSSHYLYTGLTSPFPTLLSTPRMPLLRSKISVFLCSKESALDLLDSLFSNITFTKAIPFLFLKVSLFLQCLWLFLQDGNNAGHPAIWQNLDKVFRAGLEDHCQVAWSEEIVYRAGRVLYSKGKSLESSFHKKVNTLNYADFVFNFIYSILFF